MVRNTNPREAAPAGIFGTGRTQVQVRGKVSRQVAALPESARALMARLPQQTKSL